MWYDHSVLFSLCFALFYSPLLLCFQHRNLKPKLINTLFIKSLPVFIQVKKMLTCILGLTWPFEQTSQRNQPRKTHHFQTSRSLKPLMRQVVGWYNDWLQSYIVWFVYCILYNLSSCILIHMFSTKNSNVSEIRCPLPLATIPPALLEISFHCSRWGHHPRKICWWRSFGGHRHSSAIPHPGKVTW